MLAIVACMLSFGAAYWAGKRSLGQGLVALLAAGYMYGILRANVQATASHFIFDAGLLGLYLSQSWSSSDPEESRRLGVMRLWAAVLIGWCCLLVFLPFQPLLVSLVGLRGSVLFIPVLLLGVRLKHKDLMELVGGITVLNLVVLGFAAGEYLLGVPLFYPVSPVTMIIYASKDAGEGFFRIPGTFTNAHEYGGTMVCSLPFLIGGWNRSSSKTWRALVFLGMGAAMFGVLLSATRVNFVLGSALVVAAILTSKLNTRTRMVFVLLVVGIGVVALSNDRFQRFKSLGDTDAVAERVAGSVNRGFWEILMEYPMGNGLGGGGTSIPYFLQGQVRNPIGMENEYARILCEQGIVGLLLWISFILWFLRRAKIAFAKCNWVNGRRMAWCLCAVLLGTAWIGTGLLTAIPATAMMLLAMGWCATPEPMESQIDAGSRVPLPARQARLTYVPALR